jgi:hypothetical protein
MNEPNETEETADEPLPWFRHPLARELSIVLVIKIAIIAAIAYYFFGPSTKARQDPDSVASAVLNQQPDSPRIQTTRPSEHQ